MSQPAINGVHLVGSVPLKNEEEVFGTIGPALGSLLRRLPDGETGSRQQWVQFQLQVLGARDEFELIDNPVPGMGDLPPTLRLRDGFDAGAVDFGSLGYEDAAIASFAAFDKAQSEGLIEPGVRFQISMPTPLANAIAWLQFNPEFEQLNARYEQAMLAELDRIVAALPQDRIAIQWDVCFEVVMYEGWMPMPAGVTRESIAQHLTRISEAVPAEVELGYHFCFGDFNHEHVQQPVDLGRVVDLINAFMPAVKRSVQFIHLPVPIERDDDAYFAPLKSVQLPEAVELYVGLLHYRDGVEGARRRIAAAGKVLPKFGVATECGMGRRPAERGGGTDTFERLLELHREVAGPI